MSSDGSHKPSYAPPTLGEELERSGMKYDFSEQEQGDDDGDVTQERVVVRRQKRNRKRNKNSRRDSTNRPHHGEMNMENMNQSNTESKNEKTPAANGQVVMDGPVGAMIGVLQQSMGDINNTLKQFGSTALTLNDSMQAVVNDAAQTRDTVKKTNDWTVENLKGDVRRALVQVGVAGALAGVAALITYAFRKDEAETVNAELPAPTVLNGATKRATT